MLGIAALLSIATGCGGSAPPAQDGDQGTTPPPVPHFAVATYHNDNLRSGINAQETKLTPANVNVVSFGRLASVAVQGQIYAQPLYIDNVTMSDNKAHKLVIVATEHDQVYAIDADDYQVLWQRSLLDSQGLITPIPTGDVDCQVLGTEVGITGTPVIDPDTETVYLVAATKSTQNGQPEYIQKIYALGLKDGQDQNAPATISTPSGSGDYGVAEFSALLNLQRAALLLENGNVYVSWASHCDNGSYSGWMMGFSTTNLQLISAWTPDPSGMSGGMWMSGGGPAADSAGNIFMAVGNGWSDASTGGSNYGDSVVRLTVSGSQISVPDYFMPYDYDKLYNEDLDLGAGTPVLLPVQTGARYPNLMVAGGKEGTVYLLNRDDLGQWHANDDSQVVQSFGLGSGIFNTPIFWNNTLYYGVTNKPMQAFAFDPSSETFNTTPVDSSSMSFAFAGVSPSMSTNNGNDAVLWTVESSQGSGVLRAFDPTKLSTELYDSEMSPDRDRVDGGIRFAVPTVANGEVFVGAQTALDIYGQLAQ